MQDLSYYSEYYQKVPWLTIYKNKYENMLKFRKEHLNKMFVVFLSAT